MPVIGLIFALGIFYLGLSIDSMRPITITFLVLLSLPIAFAALWFLYQMAQVPWRRKTRPSSLVLNDQSATENKEIDPLIFSRVQTVSKIKSIIDKHIETLARRRLMLVTVDHYGIVDSSGWTKEFQRFVYKVVQPELSYEDKLNFSPQEMDEIYQVMIEDRVRMRSNEIKADLDFSGKFTPTQFEQWCAKTLNAKGWKAITTKASGDQGADVIADKNGQRIVLQCKLYSGTVGNKAVQEAYSAQRHYATNASAVVTNAEFSPSARELAGTTGVLLLHYGDLTRLDSLLTEINPNHNIPS